MPKRLLLIGLLFWSFISFAQEIKPDAAFQKDSIMIGEPMPFSVWITYPKAIDVVFPDSLFDFSPFELERKDYFLTESDSLNSFDSVVYHLSTFEIDTIQHLQVPIYLVDEFDSTLLLTNLDSVILHHVVTEIPDSVALKINTSYTKVPLQFNYPYLIIGVSAGLIIILILALVFGKSLRRQLKLYRLKRRHTKFLSQFEDILTTAQIVPEPALYFWKSYMEKLLKKPYTKLTTKEIKQQAANKQLVEALKVIDRMIYAHADDEKLRPALESLKNYSQLSYEAKNEELKHG